MAAATVAVTHNTNTKTIVYTWSAAMDFELVAGGGVNVVLSEMTADKFAFYKTAYTSSYAAPAAGNVDTNCSIVSVAGEATNKILTVVYSGVFPAIDLTEFGYICYPILYKAADISGSTDSSANHKQAVFGTPVIIPTADCSTFSADTNDVTPLAMSLSAGATLETTYADQKILLALVNADSSNAETVTIYHGDSIQGTQDLSISVAKSTTTYVMLESGKYKFLYHDGLTNKYYLRGTADVKLAAVILP